MIRWRKAKGLLTYRDVRGKGVKVPETYKEVDEKTALLPKVVHLNIFSSKAFFMDVFLMTLSAIAVRGKEE